MKPFTHSRMPRASEQAPLRTLLLQNVFQKQNDAMCSSHAWQGHACCLQLPHPNSGLKPCLCLVPIIVTTYYCAPSRAAAAVALGRLPFARAIACLIFSCRQKKALKGSMLNRLWVHLIAECTMLIPLLYVMHTRHCHSEDHVVTCRCSLHTARYAFQTLLVAVTMSDDSSVRMMQQGGDSKMLHQ